MEGFPTFKRVFEKGISVPRYLEFLNFASREGEISEALGALKSAIDTSPDPAAEVQSLLSDLDWRPNIVGAVAMLMNVVTPAAVASLWAEFDRGSWVSPQLAVTAFKIDPEFGAQSVRRILSGCIINDEGPPSLPPLERHVATGPVGSRGRSAKAISALTYLYKRLPNADPAVISSFNQQPIRDLLLADEDGGAEIAESWMDAISKLKLRG